FARSSEELRRALKRRRVREHRKTGCATGFISDGQRRRIEIGADEPLRRARLLDFCDQAVAIGGLRTKQRGSETARGRHRPCFLIQRGIGDPRFRGGNLFALVLGDVVQNGHAFETSIRRSRRVSAAPESMDIAVLSTPSAMLCALPATISAAAALRSTISR